MDKKLSHYWSRIQGSLFPTFESEVGVQTPKHGAIMVVLDVLDLDRFHLLFYPKGRGRPPRNRIAIARAFVAKCVLNLPSTKSLLDRLDVDPVLRRLCGFESNRRRPCEATFSNAFAEFSQLDFGTIVHQTIIQTAYSEQLNNKIVGHISRDSTDISAPGKVPKVPKNKKGRRKPKRLRRQHRRIVKQQSMTLEQMLEDLPTELDASTKRGHSWKGFKLHLDIADSGVPISAIVTSASLHDSQAAIPLEEMTSRRVISLYSLMDAAYDAKEIRDFVAGKAKVAIIEPHTRPGQTIILDPAERKRYGERTTAERAFSRIKDGLGGCQVTIKGPKKVCMHLMLSVIVLAAEQLVRHFT